MRIRIRGDEVRVAAGGSSLRLTPDGVVYRTRDTTARASWWTTRRWSWSDVVLIHAGSSHPTQFVPVLTLFDAAGRAVVLLPTRAPKVADARRLADALAPFELLHRTQFDLAMFRSETWAPRGRQEGLTVRWWSGKHRPTPDHQSPGVIELSSAVRLVRVVAPIAVVVVFFGGFMVRCAVDGARRNQATTRAVQEVASGEWVPVA